MSTKAAPPPPRQPGDPCSAPRLRSGRTERGGKGKTPTAVRPERSRGAYPRTSSRTARPPQLRPKRRGLLLLPLLLLSCREAPDASPFPEPQRPVAPIVSSSYLNEDARDSVGEFETVVGLAGIAEGMVVADIGAGEGYYTVRLSPLVGEDGRVLAQDIVPETIRALADRVQRERLDNVALKLGQPNNPLLPDASFDRVLLIHMYHEIQRPSEFLWNLRGALKRDGSVVVVDADRPTDRHGTPPRLLVCEFNAVGYELTRFERLADTESYFAQFIARGPRPDPRSIPICPN